jgi:hypothetical protein
MQKYLVIIQKYLLIIIVGLGLSASGVYFALAKPVAAAQSATGSSRHGVTGRAPDKPKLSD